VDTNGSQNNNIGIGFSIIKIVSRKSEIEGVNGGGDSGSVG